jgi:hypothetical protein
MLTGVRATWPLGGRDEEVAHVGALVRRGRGVLLARRRQPDGRHHPVRRAGTAVDARRGAG